MRILMPATKYPHPLAVREWAAARARVAALTAELHAASAVRQRAVVHEAALRQRLLDARVLVARLERAAGVEKGTTDGTF